MTASITLRELIRIDAAKELTMTGRIFTGEEAYTLGLVTKVCDDPWTVVSNEVGKSVNISLRSTRGTYNQ